MRPRHLSILPALVLAVGACTQATTSTSTSTTDPPPPSATAGPAAGPIGEPVRHPAGAAPIYFVMLDRFANGDAANDRGGIDSNDPLITGFLPADKGFHHGGDLAGLTGRLGYLADLGIGAIWITPPFVNRWVQGNGTNEGSSSSYHGYWNIDWTRIDPHLGSDQDMVDFIAAAHDLGLRVYFDLVVNHTGDVIQYEEGGTAYRPTSLVPYLDADGNPIDLEELAVATEPPPALDPAKSFPYVPSFATETDATVKAPDWLNDATLYHNRGNSTFEGESSTLGDFFGLDDLFTEHPRVVAGWIELTEDILQRFPIDGFRVDTVKHVNDEFWPQWTSAVGEATAGEDFLVFGEIFSEDPIFNSRYTTALEFPSLLDFGFNGAATRFITGGSDAQILYDAFDDDDWFTDTDSNASMLVTFIGNHDIGRMGSAVLQANPGASDAELLARSTLGFELLFLSRGIPAVYYGDEQGFTGDGGDKLARQDMFPTLVPEYLDDFQIGAIADPASDHFDQDHPLYRTISDLIDLRTDNPALVTGAHILRTTGAARNVFAVSRIDREEQVEYLVVVNGGENRTPATFRTISPGATFSSIRGPGIEVTATSNGTVTVSMEPLTTVVLRADRPISNPEANPAVTIVKPAAGAQLPTFRYRIEAELADERYAEVSFAVTVDGAEPIYLGTDDAAPYQIYWDNSAFADGSRVEFITTAVDGAGRVTVDRVTATLGGRR
jgi:alpha-amylase